MMRSVARRFALDALSLVPKRNRRQHARHGYFHSLPDESVKSFDLLLGELSNRFTTVPFSQAVANDLPGTLAWSVDDGFGSCRTAGDVFVRHGISACFFVSPTLLDGVVTTEEFFRTAENIEPTAIGWDGAERLLEQGHEIGSHSISHRDMSSMSAGELDDELGRSRELLEARLGPVKHFAWPFGRFFHFSAEAHERATRAGYVSVSSAERPGRATDEEWTRGVVARDHLDPVWPRRHSRHFITR